MDLRGAGQVGGALLRLLDDAKVLVTTVHRRSGIVDRRDEGERTKAAVLVDATPPSFAGPAAEAWVAFLEATLRAGTAVVTCNKAPLAIAWERLAVAAEQGGVPLAATATVGGGTPVLAPLRQAHADRPLLSVEATLSGTLGVVLPRVHEGVSLDQAVAEAQAAGLCEPDARLDLDGTDAWAKACIVHNALWPAAGIVQLRDRPAPLDLDEAAIRALARPAVVARITPGRVTLGLEEWNDGSTGLAAGEAGLRVRARTGDGGLVELSGAGAGPATTAHALLGDVQAVLAGRLSPGLGP